MSDSMPPSFNPGFYRGFAANMDRKYDQMGQDVASRALTAQSGAAMDQARIGAINTLLPLQYEGLLGGNRDTLSQTDERQTMLPYRTAGASADIVANRGRRVSEFSGLGMPSTGGTVARGFLGRLGLAGGTARVPGQGDGTVDKVPAVLAPGEAVLNRAASDALGRGLIAALNGAGRQKMGMV